MTTLRDLPGDRYVLVCLGDGTLAAVPDSDPLAAVARRWLNGKAQQGDEAALRAWLAAHPSYRITHLPAQPCVQLELWEMAA